MRRQEPLTSSRVVGLPAVTTLTTLVALVALVAGADVRSIAPRVSDQTTIVGVDGHRVRAVAAVVAAAARHLLGTGARSTTSAPVLAEASSPLVDLEPRLALAPTNDEPGSHGRVLLAERLLDLPPPVRG